MTTGLGTGTSYLTTSLVASLEVSTAASESSLTAFSAPTLRTTMSCRATCVSLVRRPCDFSLTRKGISFDDFGAMSFPNAPRSTFFGTGFTGVGVLDFMVMRVKATRDLFLVNLRPVSRVVSESDFNLGGLSRTLNGVEGSFFDLPAKYEPSSVGLEAGTKILPSCCVGDGIVAAASSC